MAGGLISLKWNDHQNVFLNALSSLRTKEQYCDVTLACEGKFYKVHKIVLSSCSDYFANIIDATPCNHPVIVLEGMNCFELEAVLNYMYCGFVEINQENLGQLMKVASRLQIKGLGVHDNPHTKSSNEKVSEISPSLSSAKRKRSDHIDVTNKELNRTSFNESKHTNDLSCKKSSNRSVDVKQEVEEPSIVNDTFTNEIKEEILDVYDVSDIKNNVVRNKNYSSNENMSISTANQNYFSDEQNHDYLEDINHFLVDDPCSSDDISILEDSNIFMDTNNSNATPIEIENSQDMTLKCCSLCGYKGHDLAQLRKHLRTHTGEKPFKCPYCDHRSAQSSNIKVHINRKHQIFEEHTNYYQQKY